MTALWLAACATHTDPTAEQRIEANPELAVETQPAGPVISVLDPNWHPRLLLVGDTGEHTPLVPVVSKALAAEFRVKGADIHLVALGDLYYEAPPVGPGCVAALTERYRDFYAGLPAERIHPVLGNHDTADASGARFSAEARDCSTAAFHAMGWTPSEAHPSAVIPIDAGFVSVDLALLDAGLLGEGAVRPSLTFREDAGWRLYASHYVWKTSSEKCGEAGKIPVDWLGRPPMDFWLNGHAHHLEAVAVDGPVALTSGAGMQMRPIKECEGVSSLFRYAETESQPRAGYLVLDLDSQTRARVTPVVCTAMGCVREPVMTCTRAAGTRGVSCAPAGS